MLGFGKKHKIEKVYDLINEDKNYISSKKAETIFLHKDIVDIFNLSGDVTTTATLALLWQESELAKRMAEEATFEKIANGFIEKAEVENKSAKILIDQEADRIISVTKQYGESISEMLDSGRIVGNKDVREYCATKITILLSGWMRYRLKLESAFEEIKSRSSKNEKE